MGVFAKNERGYRLTAKKALLIATNLILSVEFIRRKLLKTTHTKDCSVHTNSERIATFNSDLKIINLIPKKSFRYYNSYRLFFDAFV